MLVPLFIKETKRNRLNSVRITFGKDRVTGNTFFFQSWFPSHLLWQFRCHFWDQAWVSYTESFGSRRLRRHSKFWKRKIFDCCRVGEANYCWDRRNWSLRPIPDSLTPPKALAETETMKRSFYRWVFCCNEVCLNFELFICKYLFFPPKAWRDLTNFKKRQIFQ